MIAILHGIVVGAAFSVMAAVQRGADHGLVPQDLEWFVIAMILLLGAAYGLSVFFAATVADYRAVVVQSRGK